METPNVNVAQILALVTGVVGLFVGFGLTDNDHAQIIIGAAATIVPAVWILADAIIRHGRSRVLQAPPVTTIVSSDSPSAHSRPDEELFAPPERPETEG